MKADFDIAVLGSGFGGAIISMITRKLGYSTVLIESGKHPRFAIGESSTPFSNLLLEKIAADFNLPELAAFTDWGRWQRAHPEVGCGLKRGFSFFHHHRGQLFSPDPKRSNELLVAASPRDSLADTHWYRPELDACLVEIAIKTGVEFIDQTSLLAFAGLDSDSDVNLHGERLGQPVQFRARYVIDASGPRGALFKALGLQEAPFELMPATEALFSHFRGVSRWSDLFASRALPCPPYPVDDAAVHHLFEGGWIWALRFNNGIVSAGIAAETWLARKFALHEGATAWTRVLREFPTIAALFAKSSSVEPLKHLTHLSFRASRSHGSNWSMLPSASGFVDPLLSTGFALNFFGILRHGMVLKKHGVRNAIAHFEMSKIAIQARRELDATARLIAALYQNLNRFENFRSLTLLYFAAVSFAESAWRLGQPQLASSFLLCDQEPFAPRFNGICRGAADPKFPVHAEVLNAIANIDVAGLSNPDRNGWFPVDSRDLLSAHAKLGVNRQTVSDFLARYDR